MRLRHLSLESDFLDARFTERVIAQEGLYGDIVTKFKDLFEPKEKGHNSDTYTPEANLQVAAELEGQLKTKKGLREDPTDIRLDDYARWYSLEGKLVESPNEVIRSLEETLAFAKMVKTDYPPLFKKLAAKIAEIIEVMGKDLDKAYKLSEVVLTDSAPPGLAKLATRRPTPFWGYLQDSPSMQISKSFLGTWVLTNEERKKYGTGRALWVQHWNNNSKITSAEVRPYTPDQAKQALDLIAQIETIAKDLPLIQHGDNPYLKDFFQKFEKISDKVWDQFEKNDFSNKQVAEIGDGVWAAAYVIVQTQPALLKYATRTNQVVLKVVRKSIEQMN